MSREKESQQDWDPRSFKDEGWSKCFWMACTVVLVWTTNSVKVWWVSKSFQLFLRSPDSVLLITILLIPIVQIIFLWNLLWHDKLYQTQGFRFKTAPSFLVFIGVYYTYMYIHIYYTTYNDEFQHVCELKLSPHCSAGKWVSVFTEGWGWCQVSFVTNHTHADKRTYIMVWKLMHPLVSCVTCLFPSWWHYFMGL